MSRSITPAPTPPQTITVSTAAGFNAGDLVYFNGSTGDYGTPTPTTQTSVTVTGSKIQPLLGGIVGTYTSTVDGISGSCNTKAFAAALTNSNIVQVFVNSATNEPSFRVVNAAGTVVVAVTSISASLLQTSSASIAVAALTGGGFVVAWLNDSGGTTFRPCYAVYDNAGTVVAAASQDLGGTGIGVAGSGIRAAATPSGGFVIAYYSAASTLINARGYAANGTASFAWVNLSGVTTTSGTIGLAVRSNGDFLLAGQATGNTTGLYAIWSSVGAGIVGSTTIPFTNGTSAAGGAFDACCLSNGTTFAIAYTPTIASTITIAFRFLPTGNVLGSEFYIPGANYSNTNGLAVRTMLSIAPLTSNRFIVFGSDSTSNRNVVYAVFNSSGGCLSGTSGTTSTAAVPIQVINSYFIGAGSQVAVFEAASGLINIYYQFSASKAYSVLAASINGTTYAVTVITPTATAKAVGITAGQQAALYQPSASTPLAAGFSIAPGDYPVSYPFGTVIKSPEQVESANVNNCSCATLLDGRVVIAYITNASLVKVAVYSVDGVLTQTLNIGSNGTAVVGDSSLVDIAAMTGGGFVIAYTTSVTATQNVYLYSSALTQVGSVVTIASSAVASYSRVAGITGDRYVVAFGNGSNLPSYSVYDNTNTVIINGTIINAAAHSYISVAALANGGFLISATLNSTGFAWVGTWSNVSGNTFAPVIVWVAAGTANTIPTNRAASNASGVAFLPIAASSTGYTGSAYTTISAGGQPNTSLGSLLSITGGSSGVSVGVTGNGTAIFSGLTTGPVIYLQSGIGNVASLSATLFPVRTGTAPQIGLTSGYGPTFGLIFISSAVKLYYAILTDAITQTAAVTSAETCAPIAIYPGTASGTAIQNTVFTGVALQTVPAGGAGAVQTDGPAQLNSNYPAGTTYRAFDHQGQGVPGVKGSIVGRAITLQGT